MSKQPFQLNRPFVFGLKSRADFRGIKAFCFQVSFWLIIVLGIGLAGRADAAITHFNNPIQENIADPMIFREVNATSGAVTYYMAGTSFARYRSKDMVNWERLSNWSNINQLGISGVWACELIKKGSTYYLYFSAIKPSGDKRVVYVATGTNIKGTFSIQSTPVVELPNNNTIDPHPFLDPATGKYYLYYSQDQASDPENIARIFVIELAANMLGMQGGTSASLCVEAETQNWESQWQEGASVREHNGVYYLFYSSRCYCSDSYAVGYATSSSPKGGTWTKYAGNPILQKRNTPAGKISGPGHINLVKAPDGVEDWMVYHAHSATAAGGQRHAAMERYRFQPAAGGGPDIVVVDGPTLTKQPLPAGAPIAPSVGPLETFNNVSALNRNRWRKVRQENAANYQLTGSQLMIQPRTGSLFTRGVDNPAGNVITQYAPETWDWQGETSLSFVGVPVSRQGDIFGGIVAWQDARHYVAARIDAGKRLSIETCNQTQGSAEVLTTLDIGTPITNASQLRLVYEGGKKQFTLLASTDGTTYLEVATVPSPLSDQRFTYVGPVAYARAGTAEVNAAEVRFDWFQVNETTQEYRWPLDIDATDVLGGLTGSSEGTPTFVSDRVQGIGSLRLDGNSGILLTTNDVLQDETFACTLSFWFKPERSEGLQVLYDEGGAQSGFSVRLNGATLQACVASNFTATSVSLSGIVSNVWHFATVTFDGRNGNPGALAIYCDGRSSINTNAPGSIPTHTNGSGFGAINSNYAFGDSGGRFTGGLDDVRLIKGTAIAPSLVDGDGDGLTDAQELAIGTNPNKSDTDNDGVSDGFEVLRSGTNPNDLTDKFEIRVVSVPVGFVIPSTSAFSFVFEQWNHSNAEWTVKAGPFSTSGSPMVVSLEELGISTNETSVILRVRIND